MHVSKETELYMEFFTTKYTTNYNLDVNNDKFKSVIKMLYHDVIKGYTWAESNFDELQVQLKKIDIISQIPQPDGFGSKYFSSEARKHILNNSQFTVSYKFQIEKRTIEVVFITPDDVSNQTTRFDCYLKKIMSWIYIANHYSSVTCGTNMKLYIYLTKLKKELPNNRWDTIGEVHVNSGLSDICKRNSEIIIYREEEWFKVFVHETFHNYGLDFSIMNVDNHTSLLDNSFNVNSDFAMYETYTEFWARMMNIVYCSYELDSSNSFNNFYMYFQILLYYERIYSLYQCIKVLHFMNLTYNEIIFKKYREKGKQLYRENTNVFSYYVGVAILMINPIAFVQHCVSKNMNIFRFKKTDAALKEFYDYFVSESKSRDTIKVFHGMNTLIKETPKNMLYSCRMTISDVDSCS